MIMSLRTKHLGIGLVLIISSSAWGEVPGTIHHQGVVMVNGARFTGEGAFRFALLDSETQMYRWVNDGSAVTAPTEPTNPVRLTVLNGVYSLALGDVSLTNMIALPPGLFVDQPSLSLRVWFDDQNGHAIHRLTPDHRITAAPYSAQSGNADTFGGPLGVGMIVPFYHPALAANPDAPVYDLIPRNWVLCDGAVLNASHPRQYSQDEVNPAFWDQPVPDLRARMARGTDTAEAVGAVAGADSFNLPAHDHQMPHTHAMAHNHNMAHVHDMNHTHSMVHTHTMPHTHTYPHTHTLPTNTGSVANSGTDPGGHLYLVRDDNSGWNTGDHLSVAGGSSTGEGQHRHSLGGITGDPSVSGTLGPSLPSTGGSSTSNTGANSIANTGPSSAANTGAANPATTADASTSVTTQNGAATVPTVPRYVAVHYIIRIK